jgi:hypothetical protein
MRRQFAEGRVLRDPAVGSQTLAVANPFLDERTKTDGKPRLASVPVPSSIKPNWPVAILSFVLLYVGLQYLSSSKHSI